MKSIRSRLLLGFGLVLAVALGGFGTLAYLSAARENRADLDALLSSKAFAASRLIEARQPRLLPYMEQGFELDRHGCFLQVFNAEGELLAKSSNLREAVPLSESTLQVARDRVGVVLEDRVDAHGRPVRVATYSRSDFRDNLRTLLFLVQVGAPFDGRQAQIDKLFRQLVLGGTAFFLVALGAAAFFVTQWLHSLQAIEDTAQRISAQNLAKQRVFVPTNDSELARLAQAFNNLLDQLETAHSTQQRFVADASHELRTPLTILRGEIEVALRKPRVAEEYCEILQSNREEIERLSRLVENLLTLASADAGEAISQNEIVDLSVVSRSVVDRLSETARQNQIAVSIMADAPAEVKGDSVALDRVVFNLIENAIRYSPAGETVTVRVSVQNAEALLEVADTGTGIAPEHLPHLFERFYRVDKARSRKLGGAGLGLSIVKALVEAHGGHVEVRSEIGKGSRFIVRLPQAAKNP